MGTGIGRRLEAIQRRRKRLHLDSAGGSRHIILSRTRCPLEGNRPATTERSIHERVGEQHVDARLWQDPFAAVADELNKSPELKPENCDRSNIRYKEIETYCRPPLGPPGGAPFLTLLVSVSGTPYSEDQEARRRRRYAVLAATERRGFRTGGSAAHRLLLARPGAAASNVDRLVVGVTAGYDRGPGDGLGTGVSESATLPKFIPYEWFKRRPERPKVQRGHQRVLLLWFDEDASGGPGNSRTEIHRVHAGGARSGCARVAAARGSIATIGQALVSLSSSSGESPDSVSRFSARNSRPHSRQ